MLRGYRMEYAKIPTDLLMDGLRDIEYAAITKYSLLWALKEYEPDEATCLRYMSRKQYEFVKTYHDSIKTATEQGIVLMNHKRSADKIRYRKNKELSKIPHTGTESESAPVSSADSPSDPSRFVSYKEKNKKENIIKIKEQLEEINFPDVPLL